MTPQAATAAPATALPDGSGLRVSGPRDGRRPTIGIALYGDLTFDSRVRREAASLYQGGFDVVVVCLANRAAADDLPPGVRVVVSRPAEAGVLPGAPNPFAAASRNPLRALVGRVAWLVGYVRSLRAWGKTVPGAVPEADVWHLNDFVGLAAVTPNLRPDVPVVYDAHDLFLETGTALRLPRLARALLRRYEQRLIRRTAAVLTVNDALARVLVARYRPSRIEVVRNCPEPASVRLARSTFIRDVTGIPNDSSIVLHHGRLGSGRGVEQLIESLLEPGMERVHLVLMGFGERRLEFLEAGRATRYGGRVHLLDAVRPALLIDWVASADVAAMPIQASTLNLYLSTPNKLFESLAAGVPVVASNFPGIAGIVLDPELGPLGALCDPADSASIGAAIRSILELGPSEFADLRERCRMAARTRWNWHVESQALLELYADVTAHRPVGRQPARDSVEDPGHSR